MTSIWSPRYRTRTLLVYTVLGLCVAGALVPLLLIVLASFKTNRELAQSILAPPAELRFDNFVRAWDRGKFNLYFRSSVIVVLPVVAISTLLSALSGYAFGVLRPPGHRALFGLFLIGLAVPFEATIVPLYYRMLSLGLVNTYWGLILPQIALSVAFGAFWMRAFFLGVPRDLIEAAAIDGASTFTTFWRVLLPLAQPAILTLVVLLFIWTWNEFLLVLVMATRDEVRTLPVGLALFQGTRTADIPLQAAGSLIVALPMVIVYVIFQRQFIQGVVSGAIRG